MAKTTRDYIRRNLAQSLHSVERTGVRLLQVRETFDDGQHDEYVKFLDGIITALVLVQNLVKQFWVHAYGKFPDDYDSYRR